MIAILLLSILPRETIARDSVPVAEVNHTFNEHADPVFSQIIFYELKHDAEQVRAWRMVRSPSLMPTRDWANGGYVVTWVDGEIPRTVRIRSVRETYSQYDRELSERESLKPELRRELRRK